MYPLINTYTANVPALIPGLFLKTKLRLIISLNIMLAIDGNEELSDHGINAFGMLRLTKFEVK